MFHAALQGMTYCMYQTLQARMRSPTSGRGLFEHTLHRHYSKFVPDDVLLPSYPEEHRLEHADFFLRNSNHEALICITWYSSTVLGVSSREYTSRHNTNSTALLPVGTIIAIMNNGSTSRRHDKTIPSFKTSL